MNKNRIFTATALALSLSWMGCNKSSKLDTPSTSTPTTGAVELKLKWPLGEHIVQDMDMKQTMEISMAAQPAPIKQSMTMGQEYGITVLKANPDGGHELEMEFLRARMSMTMAGKTMMEFDSAKKSSPGDKVNEAADVFGKIVGAKIRYFLNASNEVERLEGIDEMVNRLTSGAQGSAMAPIKSMFNEGYFKQLMSQNRFMPTNAVQIGDTWPVHTEFPMAPLGVMVMDFNFTFKSWELHGKRNCARLEFQGTIKSKPDPDASPSAMSVSSLDGTVSGTSWFDPDLGITIDTSMNQDMNMVMNMPMNQGAAGSKLVMTNQMNQVITIKLVSVK